ncbi:50S ribosomal protein L3 [Thermacetogenium phaeum DSM 12270]|uniref:Large ribosomal subunit protein uL3 n=1 Tax=Thermacetogenium phaeum (strain ATCC BAA-254 / DSM 26808 / PB) TaxID=1089553 RepID=K4LXQ3_THEPS|nr:50S ribosomal protein L3 [Thermacetogenium phaeum]AFV12759.1 50S ribosomal protein L3 [Thermacetogenium phaeum DSM 12270]MDK2880513.1 large subunit ribosomal protein [Clostridia bacterium]
MSNGILGRKVGMSQVFDEEGKAVPVTVIEAGPCYVVQKKTPERDGYAALQLGFGEVEANKLNRPLRGHFTKSGVKPLRFLKEIRLDSDAVDSYEVGQEVKVDIFNPGDYVDVQGVTKGKGFAGGIKRHGFHRGPMKHGSKYHRRPGSLGAKGPARVFKGRKLPGRAGGEMRTVKNLKVVKVDPEHNLLLVRGAVPGPRMGLLLIKNSAR